MEEERKKIVWYFLGVTPFLSIWTHWTGHEWQKKKEKEKKSSHLHHFKNTLGGHFTRAVFWRSCNSRPAANCLLCVLYFPRFSFFFSRSCDPAVSCAFPVVRWGSHVCMREHSLETMQRWEKKEEIGKKEKSPDGPAFQSGPILSLDLEIDIRKIFLAANIVHLRYFPLN